MVTLDQIAIGIEPLVGVGDRLLCHHAAEKGYKNLCFLPPAIDPLEKTLPSEEKCYDVVLFEDEARENEWKRLHFLRQQNKKAQGLPNFCLADFIAPAGSGKKDYIGIFAVTAGIGLESVVAPYKAEQDDYREIMAKALADRLAADYAGISGRLAHFAIGAHFFGSEQLALSATWR